PAQGAELRDGERGNGWPPSVLCIAPVSVRMTDETTRIILQPPRRGYLRWISCSFAPLLTSKVKSVLSGLEYCPGMGMKRLARSSVLSEPNPPGAVWPGGGLYFGARIFPPGLSDWVSTQIFTLPTGTSEMV